MIVRKWSVNPEAGYSEPVRKGTVSRVGSGGAPSVITVRIIALFAYLAILKFVNIALHASELVEMQWRVTASIYSAFGWGNFVVFTVVLTVLPSLLFPRGDRGDGKRSLVFFLSWLFYSFLFAVMQLRSGDSSYLTLAVRGINGFQDLRSRLFLDFFDKPPYLALFCVASLCLYGVLFQFRRLSWLPIGVGLLSAVYWWSNLRELAAFGNRLFLLNVCFLGCVIAAYLFRGKLTRWQADAIHLGTWVTLTVAGLVYFLVFHEHVRKPVPAELAVLLGLASVVAVGLALSLGRLLRQAPERRILLPFACLAFLLLSCRLFPMSANYGHLLSLAVSFPAYTFEELVLCASLYLVVRQRTSWGWKSTLFLDATAVTLAGMWAIDFMVVRVMGVRLTWQVLTLNNEADLLYHTIRPFLPSALFLLILFGVGYGGAVKAARGLSGRSGTRRWRHTAWAAFAVFGVLACSRSPLDKPDKFRPGVLSRLIVTSPLFARLRHRVLTPKRFEAEWEALGFPVDPPTAASRGTPPKHVVLIILESCYNAYLSIFGGSDETQPQMKKFLSRMEVFPNFYSVFSGSLHARFAIVSGLYPDKSFISYENPSIPQKSLIEILRSHGFRVAFFYSSDRDYTRWYDYLRGRGIDDFYDRRNMPDKKKFRTVSWGIEERCTVAAMKAYFLEHAQAGEHLFLTYVPAAPHFPYDSAEGKFSVFPVGTPALTGDYSGAYKNNLLYIDAVLADLISFLKDTDLLDQTLVVITNDHGEMLGDDDRRLGHGWVLDPYLTNVPLIIMDPRRPGFRINHVFGCQVDILPTVLNLLDVPLPPNDFYQGISLAAVTPEQVAARPLYLNSLGDRAVIEDGLYYLWRASNKTDAEVEVFRIGHDGMRSVFTELTEPSSSWVIERLKRFEAFQETLLQDYSRYKPLAARMMHPELPRGKEGKNAVRSGDPASGGN